MEGLEECLEEIPLRDKAGLRRHGGQAHHRDQGADAKPGRAGGEQSALRKQVIPGCQCDAICGQEKAALGQRVPGQVNQRGEPGKAGEHP